MLYVFYVDAGVMITFDMALTLQMVMSLKLAIEKKLKIPADMIVLLVSGGDVLQSDNLVSSYGAGTDSSPIFLFTKPSTKENFKQPSQCSLNFLSPIEELSTCTEWSSNTGGEIKTLAELKSAVEICRSLTPSVNTVTTCAKVAKEFSECARSVAKSCEQLVLDQHLMHQGWTAVVANLEDIYDEFCERSKNFKDAFKKHKAKRDYYHERMEILHGVLESLGKIPMLPSLQLNAEAHRFSAFDISDDGNPERQCGQSSGRHSSSYDNKAYQDFGSEPFKLSEEEVFEEDKNEIEPQGANAQTVIDSKPLQESDEGLTFRSSETKQSTILQWIMAQGNNDTLQDILDYCMKGIKLIDEDPLKDHEAELRHLLEYANVRGLKQIKGIEDRLYGLDQLKYDVKNLEKDQNDQAHALTQNRDRVSSTCDQSVLPTIVQSHRYQLEKLLKNHQTLVDIKRRIAKSKEELSHILKARLEAVLTIENSMSYQDAHQMLSFQCFNQLARYFETVDQLHQAPTMFVRAVHEVVRRRTFSENYMQWAVSLASHLLNIHNEEVSRRQEFNTLFEGHFLRSLFPGMGDLPPTFATQAPSVFDARLPKLTDSDAEYVSSIFPELTNDVPKYEMDAIVQYFVQQATFLADKDKSTDAITDGEKEMDSEAETCAFEKLNRQSATEIQKTDISTTCVPETMTVSIITEVRCNPLSVIMESPLQRSSEEFENSEYYIEESFPSSLEWGRERQDNMDSYKLNMERLKEFLVRLHELCKLNILFIREELYKFKSEIDNQKAVIVNQCMEIYNACKKYNEEIAISFREETQRLTVDHELEMSDLEKVVIDKNKNIDTLCCEINSIKMEHKESIDKVESEHQSTRELLEESKAVIKDWERKLEEADLIKQKELKELQEKMHLDYKAEIESMRSRFRLVALTNMDRSPSESSLEKIERTDVIEISSHNAIILQTKENAEVEKEEAVAEAVRKAVEDSNKYWQQKIEEMENSVAKQDNEKQVAAKDVTRRLIAEKDRQIEVLREKESNLTRECTKYRETIQQLTDPETNDVDRLLKTQLSTLEEEKTVLSQQVKDLKKEIEQKTDQEKKEGDSEATISSSSSKTDVLRRNRRSHTPLGLAAGTISLSSCLPGNTVLIMWVPAHNNYTVMQESSLMYFVHSDCLQALDLSINVKNENDRRLYAIGVIESKELCYAKKSANRYHMPRTFRFYRVRVKPSRAHQTLPSCCSQKHSRTQDCLKLMPISVFTDRPFKKWLTYLHAPDLNKSVSTNPSTSTITEKDSKVCEVVTGTLINLESPVEVQAIAGPSNLSGGEEQPDSIESSSDWNTSRMQQSTISCITDMECSVGRVFCGSPLEAPSELTISAVDVLLASEKQHDDSELAEEATP